jgi:hypothetical protein
MRSIKTSFDDPIKVTPIYIDIYSQYHLDNYLQQRQIELQSKSSAIPSTNGTIKNEPISPNPVPLIPTLPSSTTG